MHAASAREQQTAGRTVPVGTTTLLALCSTCGLRFSSQRCRRLWRHCAALHEDAAWRGAAFQHSVQNLHHKTMCARVGGGRAVVQAGVMVLVKYPIAAYDGHCGSDSQANGHDELSAALQTEHTDRQCKFRHQNRRMLS